MVTMADLKKAEQKYNNPSAPTMADLKLAEKALTTTTPTTTTTATSVDPNKAAMEAAKKSYQALLEQGVYGTPAGGIAGGGTNPPTTTTQQTQPQVIYTQPNDSQITEYINELKIVAKGGGPVESADLVDDSENDNEAIEL